jgi:hypothetical protein
LLLALMPALQLLLQPPPSLLLLQVLLELPGSPSYGGCLLGP